MKTIDGRIGVWTSDEGVVGRPYVSILDTIQRGLGDRILFFPYEQWSSNPDLWFKKLYEFVGEEYYQHDFSNIEQTIRENDAGYGWGNDLHEIKKMSRETCAEIYTEDQCMYGLETWGMDGSTMEAAKEMTKFVTNSLGVGWELQSRCDGQHKH